jgi:hypothetical protein
MQSITSIMAARGEGDWHWNAFELAACLGGVKC